MSIRLLATVNGTEVEVGRLGDLSPFVTHGPPAWLVQPNEPGQEGDRGPLRYRLELPDALLFPGLRHDRLADASEPVLAGRRRGRASLSTVAAVVGAAAGVAIATSVSETPGADRP